MYMSIRERQAFAALCLAKFCEVNQIIHNSIKKLISHLMSILVIEDLAEWESKGAYLELSGRGDPLPQSLEAIVTSSIIDEFTHLVECVVEVGLVDMYGESSELSLKFLIKCIDILKNNNIELPSTDILINNKVECNKNEVWGKPISQERLNDIMSNIKYLSM
jgi:hypothetical protein